MNQNIAIHWIVFILILVIPACTPINVPLEATDFAVITPLSGMGSQPTPTPDVEMLLEAATLYRADFENGYPPELYSWDQSWHVEIENDSNSIFCNELSDDWSSFLFGLDEWENYAVSLRVKFLSANEDQSAEIYIRVNQSVDGYRASIYNNEWVAIGYYPPSLNLDGSPLSISQNNWFQVQVQFVENNLEYFLNDELLVEVSDNRRTAGLAGFGASPNTEVCVDDLLVWGLDQSGYPIKDPAGLEIEPYQGEIYTIQEKVNNKPTVPVFYPWSGNCGQSPWFDFDCDSAETPYSLIWISSGIARDIESTQPEVSPAQTIHMRSDQDTLYLISEEWHYWNLGWRTLSSDSIFYLDEIYEFHVNSEYGDTKVINFEHPDWPDHLAEKALNFKEAGFDGMMLDWWHNYAGNGRSEEIVEDARLAISKAIREKVGEDFILMGNVNWSVDDPTAQYLSGVFLELWKSDPGESYALAYSDENSSTWNPSIERMEDLLKYWNANLQSPKVIAFEPWKITTGDYIADRNTEENYKYAKLFAAMAMVIPDNGYILYADNNDDWDGGDHQHAYYDFYRTDFGKPISGTVDVVEGMAYKQFEKGIIAYNRTISEVEVVLLSGKRFKIGPIEGLFLEGY